MRDFEIICNELIKAYKSHMGACMVNNRNASDQYRTKMRCCMRELLQFVDISRAGTKEEKFKSTNKQSPSAAQIADAIEGIVAGGARWERANACDAFKGLCQQLRTL